MKLEKAKLVRQAQGALRNAPSRKRLPFLGGSLLAVGATTTALVGSALFNRMAARRAEAQTPPAGSFVEVDGVRLHYVDRGSGPAVVLLHGNGVLLQDFEASGVLGLAAERQRVIAFDRPGFGYSERPPSKSWTPEAQGELIASALVKLGVGPAVIVGHSWGTMVALAMTLNQPEAVSGLVLISGYYYPTARPDVGPFSLPAVPIAGGVLANTLAPLIGRMIAPAAIKASFAPAPVSEKFHAFPLAMTLRPSQVQATGTDTAMMIASAGKLRQRYSELTVPIVVLAGDGDLITHLDEHAEKLANEVGSAELRIVPKQGHLLHYAVPEQVVAAIEAVHSRKPLTLAA